MSTPQALPASTWRRRHSIGLLFAAAISIGGGLGITHAALDSPPPAPASVGDQAMLNGPDPAADDGHRENLTPQAGLAGANAGGVVYDLPTTSEPDRADSLACKAAQANAVLSIKQLDVGTLNQALTVAAICTVTGK